MNINVSYDKEKLIAKYLDARAKVKEKSESLCIWPVYKNDLNGFGIENVSSFGIQSCFSYTREALNAQKDGNVQYHTLSWINLEGDIEEAKKYPYAYIVASTERDLMDIERCGFPLNRVFINVNVGMNRGGFSVDKVNEIFATYPEGVDRNVFSHCPYSGEKVSKYIKNLNEAYSKIDNICNASVGNSSVYEYVIECETSPFTFKNSGFIMLRLGRALVFCGQISIPVLRAWEVKKGENLGYDHPAIEDMTVGIIPIGYFSTERREYVYDSSGNKLPVVTQMNDTTIVKLDGSNLNIDPTGKLDQYVYLFKNTDEDGKNWNGKVPVQEHFMNHVMDIVRWGKRFKFPR